MRCSGDRFQMRADIVEQQFADRRLSGNPASPRPIRPPIDVPNQSTVSTFRRAISVTMSETYCGMR